MHRSFGGLRRLGGNAAQRRGSIWITDRTEPRLSLRLTIIIRFDHCPENRRGIIGALARILHNDRNCDIRLMGILLILGIPNEPCIRQCLASLSRASFASHGDSHSTK